MKVDHFSHTSLSTYLSCQRRFYWEYVFGVTGKPTTSLAVGQLVHRALRDVSSGEMAMDAAMAYERKIMEAVDGVPPDEDFEEVYRRAAERFPLLIDYLKSTYWPPAGKPIMAESMVERTVAGVKVVGVVDLVSIVDSKAIIVDYKTTQRVPSKLRSSHRDQAIMYALLTGMANSEVHMVYFGLGAKPKIEDLSVFVTQAMIDRHIVDVIVPVALDLERREGDMEEFSTNTKSPLCSRKWCPFYDMCQGDKTLEEIADKLQPKSQHGEQKLWELLMK